MTLLIDTRRDPAAAGAIRATEHRIHHLARAVDRPGRWRRDRHRGRRCDCVADHHLGTADAAPRRRLRASTREDGTVDDRARAEVAAAAAATTTGVGAGRAAAAAA